MSRGFWPATRRCPGREREGVDTVVSRPASGARVPVRRRSTPDENHRFLALAPSGHPTVSLVRDDELASGVGRPGRSGREDEELDAVVCGTGEWRVHRPPVTGRDERPVGVVPLGMAPGSIRTPLIPSTLPEGKVKSFG